MRIELPSASWADTVHRAEDDAHTLTVASQPTTDWFAGAWMPDTPVAVRTQVSAEEPAPLTLTFPHGA
jgi:hypothetical protein